MKATVLLVDDHPLVREALRALLEERDFVVTSHAVDGDTAVSLAKELAPEVVVMDVRLPGQSGFAATEQILLDHPATVVVLVSADAREVDPGEVRRSGATALVDKGRAYEELVPAILAALSLRATPRR